MQFKWANPEKTAVHIETAPNCWSRYYEGSAEWDKYAPQLGDYVDPRTEQQIYDQEVLAPTDPPMMSPRLIEELFDWAVNGVALPDASKAKFSPIVADRKTKRTARPK